MNPRERTMMIALLSLVGVGVFAAATWFWFYVPYRQYNARIRLMEDDNEKEKAKIDDFLRDRKKLVLARVKSLPVNEAGTEYLHYLTATLPQSGLKVEEITPANDAVEMKPVSNIPGIKKVGHKVWSFTVKARGTLPQLVQTLDDLQRTPYEHRVKNLQIDRADASPKEPNPKLIITMIVETLLVAGSSSKAGLPPGVELKAILFDTVAARIGGPVGFGQMVGTLVYKESEMPVTGRSYADIGKRNIFAGAIPKEPPPPKTEKKIAPPPPPPPPPQPPGPIPAFIRLTQIVPSDKEAYFLNLFYEKDEKKISSKPATGHDTFLVASKDRTYTFFLAKVLHIEHRDVFFQVRDKAYRWHLGDTLAQAYGDDGANFLTLDVLDTLDVEIDYAWAKKEIEKDKEVKKTTKGPQKKKGAKN